MIDPAFEKAARAMVQDGTVVTLAPMDDVPPQVPRAWARALSREVAHEEIARIWSPAVDKLPRTLRAVLRALRIVGLRILADSSAALLYFFSYRGKVVCYQGRPPGAPARPEATRLPEDVQEFFREVHDGWALLRGGGEGFLSSAEWYYLSQFLGDPAAEARRLGFDPKSLLVISELSGGLRALGVDTTASPTLCWEWSREFAPRLVADPMLALDESVATFLDQMDPSRADQSRP